MKTVLGSEVAVSGSIQVSGVMQRKGDVCGGRQGDNGQQANENSYLERLCLFFPTKEKSSME